MPLAAIGENPAKARFVRILPVHASCSEEPLCRFSEGKKFLTALFCTQPESTPVVQRKGKITGEWPEESDRNSMVSTQTACDHPINHAATWKTELFA